MAFTNIKKLYLDEFTGYAIRDFKQDLLAGLTVAAVALPLALAFGVASGANAAAGLVTAIVAGLVIGIFSGAPYQISGPTGAMSAVLIVLVQKYGLQGIWIAGLLSGIFLLIIGVLKLGRFIAFIPSPVITGFTSGIALIIFIGQIDNFLGIKTLGSESALFKLVGYFSTRFQFDWHTVILGMGVILTMLFWPKKWNARFPASLLGIIFVTFINSLLKWDVATIGAIPKTLFLSDRFNPFVFDWSQLQVFITPALTITALGAIESLLCGAVASNMTGIRLLANQELIGQGLGNIVIPFFGGVPATAAIARTSVGIKSGGKTRLVSIIHSVGLLISMFLLAPVMAKIPLAALAGVLMVTAWQMNEWTTIRFIFQKRFKTAMLAFLVTMLATIALDLTQAILIGSIIAAGLFLSQIAKINVDVQSIDHEKLQKKGIVINGKCSHIKVAFITGPLFFAASGAFNEAFADIKDTHALILSMRGVPLIDTAGIETIHRLYQKMQQQGGRLMFAGTQENVLTMLKRAGLVDEIGNQNFFWSSDQAILEAENLECVFCGEFESNKDVDRLQSSIFSV
ncbi:MAG: sodium-independent anion transporter [Anaerolineaceae bacterium]|nr:sodium-independent anion transporter [Anaerolineaceae bacterium]